MIRGARLGGLLLFVGVMACGGPSRSEGTNNIKDTSASIHALASTIIVTWHRETNHRVRESMFRVSRDGGRTFGPDRSLGASTTYPIVAIDASGRAAIAYRREVLRLTQHTVEAVILEPGRDEAGAPTEIESMTLGAPTDLDFTNLTVALTTTTDSFIIIYRILTATGNDRLRMRRRNADGTWKDIEDPTPLFNDHDIRPPNPIACRGKSSRPFFLSRSLERPLLLRRSDDDGRHWPDALATDLVTPVAKGDELLPEHPEETDPRVADCAVDGDRLWLAVKTWNGTKVTNGSGKGALWQMVVNLADGKAGSPVRLDWTDDISLYDARIFATGEDVFTAAYLTRRTGNAGCKLVFWSSATAPPKTLADGLGCGEGSVRDPGGFGLGGVALADPATTFIAVSRFASDEKAELTIEPVPSP